MKLSAHKRRHLNSWEQLNRNSLLYSKFINYDDFISQVRRVYDECWGIPLVISRKLTVTEAGVITALTHNNLPYIQNQKVSKVYLKYSDKFRSYYDYAIKILVMHYMLYTPTQISKGLGINEYGVKTLLHSMGVQANQSKSGPSKIGFQEILITDALKVMSTGYTLEDNPLSEDIIIKLRKSVCQ